jgi:hypothetical protein
VELSVGDSYAVDAYVEMVAVMPKYNPFAERAGMHKVLVKDPPKQALKVASVLLGLGFDLRFLGSQRYVKGKLEGLSPGQLAELKDVFLHKGHPMLREILGTIRHKKGAISKDYAGELEKADLDKLTRLIKITGVLLQTKVYLFWKAIKD